MKNARRPTRRRFLAAAGAVFTAFDAHAAPQRGRAKIADIRVMLLQGPRTYTLVKVVSDAGVHGIGEAYGSPAVGVKEGILELRPDLIGRDPLDIEGIFVNLGGRIAGSPDTLIRSFSGIEAALWDLAGKLLNLPACALIGGRFRDRIRLYHNEGPRNMLDKAAVLEWADRMKKHPAGFTAFKLTPPRSSANVDPVRDNANHVLTTRELREIRQGFETCRDAIGWDYDLIVQCQGEFDFRTAFQLAEAVEPIKPLWLEDPLPPAYSEAWPNLVSASKVPICIGGSLTGRHSFKHFIVNYGCDLVQLDLRNAGGLLESKKIAGLSETFYLPVAAHNTGSIVSNYQTAHWAAAVRDFLAAETLIGRGNWMDDVILHDGPVVRNGYLAVPEKPGLGIELNPDVVKANLAKGERYWG
jgi:L-alanine-DL-glutamate epimerase-like enolase superfamily enzyme